MSKVFPRRLHVAFALVAVMGLAGCQDKASDAPASSKASPPAASQAAPSGAPNASTGSSTSTGATASTASSDRPSMTGEALARARTCLACHQVNRKQVGPSYQDVAARFAGNPDAVPILANAIRKGGRGEWGAVPMPAQPHVSEAEAAELARWILSLKP